MKIVPSGEAAKNPCVVSINYPAGRTSRPLNSSNLRIATDSFNFPYAVAAVVMVSVFKIILTRESQGVFALLLHTAPKFDAVSLCDLSAR